MIIQKNFFFLILSLHSVLSNEEPGNEEYSNNPIEVGLGDSTPEVLPLYDENASDGQTDVNHVQKHEIESSGEVNNSTIIDKERNETQIIEDFSDQNDTELFLSDYRFNEYNSTFPDEQFDNTTELSLDSQIFEEQFPDSFNETQNETIENVSSFLFLIDENDTLAISNETFFNASTEQPSLQNETEISFDKEIQVDLIKQNNSTEEASNMTTFIKEMNDTESANMTDNTTISFSDDFNITLPSNTTEYLNYILSDEFNITQASNTTEDLNYILSDELNIIQDLNFTNDENFTFVVELNITQSSNVTEEYLNTTDQYPNLDYDSLNVTDLINNTFVQMNMSAELNETDITIEMDQILIDITNITNTIEVSNLTEIEQDFSADQFYEEVNITLSNVTDFTNLTNESPDPMHTTEEAEMNFNMTNESPDPIGSTELPIKNETILFDTAQSIWPDESFADFDNSTGNDSFPIDENNGVAQSIVYDIQSEYNGSDIASNEMNYTLDPIDDVAKNTLKEVEEKLKSKGFNLDLLFGGKENEKKTFFEETFKRVSWQERWHKYNLNAKNFSWTRGKINPKRTFSTSEGKTKPFSLFSPRNKYEIWTKFPKLGRIGKTLIFQYSVSSPNHNMEKCANVQLKLYDCSVKHKKGWKQPILVAMENLLCPNEEIFYTSINQTTIKESERSYNSIFTLEMNKDESFKMLVNGETKRMTTYDDSYEKYYETLSRACRLDLYILSNGPPMNVGDILLTSDDKYAQDKREEFLNNISI